MMRSGQSLVLWITLCCIFVGCSKSSEQLIIFHAGSLSYPFKKAAEAFQQEFPEIYIVAEAAGSVHTLRKVTDLKRQADIIASADYRLINEMLIPAHAGYNLQFATNSMVIAYTQHSARASEIDSGNWLQILSDPAVRIGTSDPDADPCGYRTRLTLRLAEKLTAIPSIESQLLSGPRHHQRPKETDLLALLETRTIDYMFIYESVAVQHGLSYITLSDSINLSRPELNHIYSHAEITIRGSSLGEYLTIQGESITYGITILRNAPNMESAEKFVQWLLNPEKGGRIIEAAGQKLLSPAPAYGYESLPSALKIFSTEIIH